MDIRRSSFARWFIPNAAAVAAGLVVITAALLVVDRQGPGTCIALEVNSSTEKDSLVKQIADGYNKAGRRFAGRCARITVHGLTSGKAMEVLAHGWNEQKAGGLPEPQVWLPSSSLWPRQLRLQAESTGVPAPPAGGYQSISNSPLVIAMPQPKGELIQQKGALGWGEILGLSGETGWAAFGRPEWGRFTFGKDNPNLSTSGLAATIATHYAAVNRSSDLTEDDLANPAVTQFVRRIEANVSYYSDDVVDLLKDLANVDLDGSVSGDVLADLSAIVMQEELVYQYNEGYFGSRTGPDGRPERPKTPLVAVYPKEGTFNLDHPYVVLPSASIEQLKAADDFLAYLRQSRQQRRFTDIGFRDHERKAPAALLGVVRARDGANLNYFDPPDPTVVNKILAGWGALRKKANILFAIDTSGSMKGGSPTRFQVATEAVGKGISLLNSEDRVALWSFSSETTRRPRGPYAEEIALSRFDQATFITTLKSLHVEGNTALYATVRAAYQHMTKNYDRDRINAVVVLTDGKNEYDRDNDLAALLRDIVPDRARPVKVFCIAFDEQSEIAPLEQIAKVTGGKTFDARDPGKIDEAFLKVVSSF